MTRREKMEHNALVRFTDSVEQPFPDLAPRKRERRAVREWLVVTSALRRIELALRSGTVDPVTRLTLSVLRHDLTVRQLKALHRCRCSGNLSHK